MIWVKVMNKLILGDCVQELKKIEKNSVHLILSDIPYGIGAEDWDVLHSNTNTAYMGSSPSQKQAGAVFKHRGKPLNGWSEADKQIPIEYYKWCLSWVKECYDVLVPGASVFIFAGRRNAHRCISAFEDSGFIFKDMIAWEKEQAAHRAQHVSVVYNRRGDSENEEKWEGWKLGNLRPIFEPILWFMKPYKLGGTIADNIIQYGVGAYNETAFLKYQDNASNIIRIKTEKNDKGLHPTQKPIELMKVLIELVTIEGQTVLDPFCGSGSSLLAASQLNRSFIGIEVDSVYYETSKKRLNM